MKKYLELHPISEAPPKEGYYAMFSVTGRYLWGETFKNGEWPKMSGTATHWLSNEPLTGVLVDIERLKEVVNESWYCGISHDDQEETVERIINSLTNKAK